jgi:hypothetical protein
MKPVECRFEDDVLMYVATDRWPDRAPAELTAHAATCAVCGDLAVVARAMDAERGVEVPSARVPSAGTVWWHAQLRARQEAVKTVGRPITVAQAALLAVCGGAAGAVFGATTGWFQRALQIVGDGARSVAANVHLPQLPSFQVDATTFVATYGVGLSIVGLTLAAAIGVMLWAFREG